MRALLQFVFNRPLVAAMVSQAFYMRFIAYSFLRSVHAEKSGQIEFRAERPRPEPAVKAVFVVFDVYCLHKIAFSVI